jgi:hypothetical protein
MANVVGDGHRSAAYMDGTTLYAVDVAVNQKYLPYPEILYDLATFVDGAILYDRIFLLDNYRLEDLDYRFNEALRGTDPLVVRMPIDWQKRDTQWENTSALGSFLTELWMETRDYFDTLRQATSPDPLHDAADEIRASWQHLLETDLPDNKKLFAYLDTQWDSPIDRLLKDTVGILGPELRTYGYRENADREIAYRLANESNQRSLFNLRVSDVLRLPRRCGAGRGSGCAGASSAAGRGPSPGC